MGEGTIHDADRDAYPACQRIVQDLIAKHRWTLLEPDELVERVLRSAPAGSDAQMAAWAKHHYSAALYEACRQTENTDRCERGYDELARMLYRAAYNRLPELAQDITQNTVATIMEQIHLCRNPGTFVAFALGKLRGASTEALRNKGRQPYEDEDALRTIATQHGRPAPSLAQRERTRAILRSIKSLPSERQQKVILLKYFEELSDAQIAERLDISVANVRVSRHRGMEKLRQDERLKDYARWPGN
jgi:RNA polymerase sigma factor (sigma-70 family)